MTNRTNHAVIVAGGGPTGLMLAGELALAGVDVAIAERRASRDLVGLRAGGLHIRTIELLDQRGIVDRFVSQGQVFQFAPFADVLLDTSDLPTGSMSSRCFMNPTNGSWWMVQTNPQRNRVMGLQEFHYREVDGQFKSLLAW